MSSSPPIDSLGEDHARHMCGDRLWFSLTPENRAAIVQWPAAFVHELRLRFDNLHTDPNLEIAARTAGREQRTADVGSRRGAQHR